MNPANLIMLQKINHFFGNIGNITIDKTCNCYRLNFTGVANCLIIRAHFDNYPLLTYRLVYYNIWCNVLSIMQLGSHLTLTGLLQIIGLKSLFKLGLSKSPELVASFPNYPILNSPAYNPNLLSMSLG